MGRSVSNNFTSQTRKPWTDKFYERPVWGVWTCAAASPSSYVYLFGESNPHITIGVIDMASDSASTVGSYQSMRQGAGSEAANAGYYPAGISSTQLSTQTLSPAGGYFGINCNSQTSSYFASYGFQNGNFGYEMTPAPQAQINQFACTQVLSSWEQQIYDIVLNAANEIQVYPIGASHWNEVDWLSTSGSIGSLLDTTGHQTTSGQMSYNRKTNTFAFLYNTADAATNTKKMHIIKMLPGFSVTPFTTGQQIAIAMANAKDMGRYASYTVSLPSWHNRTTAPGRNGGRFVICDDDTAWFVNEQATNNGSDSMHLYKIVKNSTGGYIATSIRSFTTNAQYNSLANSHYAIRHLNSDDNKFIAIFSHFYSYQSGCNLFLVPVDSAFAPAISSSSYQDAATGAGSRTIAPMGGSNFVFCNSSMNNDSYGPHISYIRPTDKGTGENGTLALRHAGQCAYPAITTSTNYQSNFVFKVMPVTETK